MKHCNLMITRYRDGEKLHSYYDKSFKSKKEGQEKMKSIRENYEDDFDESVMDFKIVKSNKNEFVIDVIHTDYGTGFIVFRDEYKIV